MEREGEGEGDREGDRDREVLPHLHEVVRTFNIPSDYQFRIMLVQHSETRPVTRQVQIT